MAEVMRVELESGGVVCEHCVIAANPVLRFRGLMGRAELPAGEGILLRPCSSVHTFFMRFAIDVVFCDEDLRVLAIEPAVPKRRARSQRGARVTIELAAGEAGRRGVKVGDRFRLVAS